MASSFDEDAELYDELRPGYPAGLYDDLIRVLDVPPLGRILEVGCGTGQATLELARRGFRIQCVDPGGNLVDVAKRRCASYPAVTFTVARLEDWTPEEAYYDLVVSATAWHWVDPAAGYPSIHAALIPGGGLAFFWNLHPTPYTGFFTAVQRVYREVVPEWRSPELNPSTGEVISARIHEIESTGLFADVEARTYAWSRTYTSERYLKLLDTYSDHRGLTEERRRRLYEGIRSLIEADYHGVVERPYLSTLFTARRLDRG